MTVVIDASAVMALMLGETGADEVAKRIRGSLISAVNVSECCARGVERGASADDVMAIIRSYEMTIVAFDAAAALDTAALRNGTRPIGASLGDRACLALARRRGLSVLTADRRLAEIDRGLDIDVCLIR